jgi:hypothetical protein
VLCFWASGKRWKYNTHPTSPLPTHPDSQPPLPSLHSPSSIWPFPYPHHVPNYPLTPTIPCFALGITTNLPSWNFGLNHSDWSDNLNDSGHNFIKNLLFPFYFLSNSVSTLRQNKMRLNPFPSLNFPTLSSLHSSSNPLTYPTPKNGCLQKNVVCFLKEKLSKRFFL